MERMDLNNGRYARSSVVYINRWLRDVMDGSNNGDRMSWYPDGSTLCSYCYSVCTLVYKSADKSIYECLKCKREMIVNHEEVDW